MVTKIFLHECPACGYVADRVSGVNSERAPGPGDATVCIECGAISEFDFDMAPVIVSAERAVGPEFADCRVVQRRVRQMRGLPV